MTNYIDSWPEGRTPRSLPYRQGFERGYHGTDVTAEYKAGSAEHDAYWSGYQNGKAERKLDAISEAV